MDYANCTPIRITMALGWEIVFKDNHKQLLLTSPELTVPEVVNITKRCNPGKNFLVSNINVGLFNLDRITPTVHSYKSDARQLDQDIKIQL